MDIGRFLLWQPRKCADELNGGLQGRARKLPRRLRGQRPAAARRQKPGISQETLSSVTKLHRTEIGKIEQGHVEPRLTTLVILAEGLGVTVNDLVEDLPVPVQRKPSPQNRPEDARRRSG